MCLSHGRPSPFIGLPEGDGDESGICFEITEARLSYISTIWLTFPGQAPSWGVGISYFDDVMYLNLGDDEQAGPFWGRWTISEQLPYRTRLAKLGERGFSLSSFDLPSVWRAASTEGVVRPGERLASWYWDWEWDKHAWPALYKTFSTIMRSIPEDQLKYYDRMLCTRDGLYPMRGAKGPTIRLLEGTEVEPCSLYCDDMGEKSQACFTNVLQVLAEALPGVFIYK